MIRTGVLSDTHGYIHPSAWDFFRDCDELWHAGDIGDAGTAAQLKSFRPLEAVYGNIDGTDIRALFPKVRIITRDKIKVVMTHIGGYPGRYEKGIGDLLEREKPKIFICGHSHILKIQYDKRLDLLHINPGAAGISGFHKSITMVRFVIDGEDIRDLEVLDIPRKREF